MAAVVALGAGVSAAAAAAGGSGLPWNSGASCADAAFAAWRGGRRLDANVIFVPAASWAGMGTRLKSAYFKSKIGLSRQLVISFPMLTEETRGQFRACAGGAFDAVYKNFGAILASEKVGNSVLRLGWEWNRGPHSHPFGVDSAAQLGDYAGCFRREAKAIKSTAPGLRIEWTLGRYTAFRAPVTDGYPGDDVVDIIGTHYYDNPGAPFHRMETQALWDKYYSATWAGGPQGLGTVLDFAVRRHKPLAVSEWGLWGNNAAGDDPVYVQNMYRFFEQHANVLAYENYYDCGSLHELYPATLFPKASALYRRLWSAGQ